MIICTTPEQLYEWIKCEYFQIDLFFKCVAGEINEFEVNYYNSNHNLSKLFKFFYFFNSYLLHIKEFFMLYLILYFN